MQISKPVFFYLLVGFFCAQGFAFVVFGLPSLEGRLGIELFADTLTYERIAIGAITVNDMVSVSSNLWGPVWIAKALAVNRTMIFVFNVVIIAISLVILTQDAHLKRLLLLFLLLSSCLFMFSFFGVNKEVLLFLVSVFLFRFARTLNPNFIIAAILISPFIRWQMTLFCLVFWALISVPLIRQRPTASLAILLLVVSFIYGLLHNSFFEALDSVAELGEQQGYAAGASGVFSGMLEIQRNYGYFLVFIPKSAQLMMAMAFKIDFNLIWVDFWNYFVITFQSLQNIFLVAFSIYFWRHFDSNVRFMILLFLIIFVLTPIFGPRYLYPVTLWLIFCLCSLGSGRRQATGDLQFQNGQKI